MHKKILLLLLAFIAGNCCCKAQTADTTVLYSYLRANMQEITLSSDEAIPVFDHSFYNNTLFLFGENHGSANPQLFDILLFKQLYKNAGVRNYIAEMDATKAWLLNKYLRDGNEEYLKKVFSSWIADTAQWANTSNYKKFQALHLFYQSLPASQKFTILGIDAIQDYGLLKEYTHFFADGEKEKPIQLYLDSLQRITDTISYKGRAGLGNFARRLLRQFENNKKNYSKALAGKTKAFQHFITSLSFSGAGMYRDSVMYRNMQSIVNTFGLQQKKMYGFLGFYHCLQAGYEKSVPFAAALEKYMPAFSGKIISIQMLALQSKTLLPYMAQVKQMMPPAYADKLRKENPDFGQSVKYIPYDLSNDNGMMKVDGIQLLKTVTKPATTTLFRLNNINTPFSTGKLLAEVTGFQTLKFTNPDGNTLQAFQYIILFRDSKAAIPIE